ncbi:MAG TPA: hypothetical protein VJ715_04140 [Pyrinomonadaceae bacterium]|nr:hypothetical protein [Pyrinomonadaceae bacterium]
MIVTQIEQRTSLRRLLLSLLLLASLGLASALTRAAVPQGVPSVVIQQRKTVLVRSGKFARDFPDRKRAIITYPVVVGPRTSPVLRKIRALFDFKNIFGSSLAEYRASTWLSEFAYKVGYNRDYILDITFTQEGVGAYPDGGYKHFAINLRTGDLIRAADAFDPAAHEKLAAMVDAQLQAENQETIKQVGSEDRASAEELLKDLKFTTNNLDNFAINDQGITFLFDAEFPHAVQAFEPGGSYFFSYADLKPYIKPDGPLAVFIR